MTAEGAQLDGPALNLLQNKPLVSIVLSSLNQGQYIEETILSVLTQDYERIELIVVDGGSTDNTLEILRKFDPDDRMKWASEPDDGPHDAYNKGLFLAHGDIIGLQNSSDTYQPHAIAEAVLEFKADPKLALVTGSIIEIDANGERTDVVWNHPDEKLHYTVDDLVILENYPPGQSTFFRRDIAISIGGFSPKLDTLLNFFQLDYMMEALRLGYHLLSTPRPWGNFRRHPGALSRELRTRDAGLTVCRERNLAYKQISKRYKGFLTRKQVRELRRPGYLTELRYRVGTLRQIIPAIPALWGYLRFGGRLGDRDLRPRRNGWLPYLASFTVDRFSRSVPKR